MSQHPITDAGRRLSDAVRDAQIRGGTGRWIAARVADGRGTENIYESRSDAVRAIDNLADEHAPLMVPPAPMPPAEATAWLDLHRRMHAAGMDLRDPDRDVPLPTGPTGPQTRRSGLTLPGPTRIVTPRRRR